MFNHKNNLEIYSNKIILFEWLRVIPTCTILKINIPSHFLNENFLIDACLLAFFYLQKMQICAQFLYMRKKSCYNNKVKWKKFIKQNQFLNKLNMQKSTLPQIDFWKCKLIFFSQESIAWSELVNWQSRISYTIIKYPKLC